jgi:hypothetical protein
VQLLKGNAECELGPVESATCSWFCTGQDTPQNRVFLNSCDCRATTSDCDKARVYANSECVGNKGWLSEQTVKDLSRLCPSEFTAVLNPVDFNCIRVYPCDGTIIGEGIKVCPNSDCQLKCTDKGWSPSPCPNGQHCRAPEGKTCNAPQPPNTSNPNNYLSGFNIGGTCGP